MAARFWVGGTGNWDAADTTHWSTTSGGGGGSAVPTSSDDVTFDAASGGGTVTITATANCLSFTMGAFTGTVNTNGQTVNVSGSMTVSGSGVRTLTLGASAINTGFWDLTTSTNLTFNANTSTITISSAGSSAFSTVTYNAVSITGATHSISGAATFATFTRTPTSPTKTNDLTLGNSIVVTGTFTVSDGATVTNRVYVRSSTVGTAVTITAATVSVSNADFRDITGAGAGSWNLSAASGGSGDCGGNTGITFTTPATQTANGTTSFSWSNAARWSSRVPLPQDDVVINLAMGTAQTITADMPRLGKSIDWTGTTWTTSLTWARNTSASIFGSLTIITGLSVSGSSGYIFEGRGSYTLTNAGTSWGGGVLQLDAPGGTLQILDNLTSTGAFQIGNGTFDANDFNVSLVSFGSGTGTSSTILMGSGTWSLSGTGFVWNYSRTVTCETSLVKFTDTSSSAITFAAAGRTFNNVWFSRGASTGSITISGNNTFADFKDDGTAAHSILFTAASTQTVTTFTVSGNGAGNEISINSTTTGTHTLTKAGGGTILRGYLNIQHSIATPSNTWYAGTTSINNQGDATAGSGWIFTDIPPPSSIFKTAFRTPLKPAIFKPGNAI